MFLMGLASYWFGALMAEMFWPGELTLSWFLFHTGVSILVGIIWEFIWRD